MSTKKLQIIGSIGGSGGSVSLDTTLTQSGKAADAKAVGDALAGKQPIGDYALKSDIPEVGSGGAAIIDVAELPTENIREDVFYRKIVGYFANGRKEVRSHIKCVVVEDLPEEGQACADATMENFVFYYSIKEHETYGYVPESLAAMVGVTVGWYLTGVISSFVGLGYSDIAISSEDILEETWLYLWLDFMLYENKMGVWTDYSQIGLSGRGTMAEVFNYDKNEATGDYSHAEGLNTTASEKASHAEGNETVASGYFSHAEGNQTIADAFGSHAEGHDTTASDMGAHAEGTHTTATNIASHAEGEFTTARGRNSHAEGERTIASTVSQHVQGKYNIIDTSSVGDALGKYAHIVGNGTSDTSRSNAHTLDWNGNAWYQGDVYTGGTGQDDPEAKKLATEEYVNSKMSSAPSSNSAAIIDVTSLPTENINESAFYRLMTGHYVYNQEIWESFVVHCVESLPETGLPATNEDISMGNIYYSITDNEAYGYIDDMLSMGMSVPVGWYDAATLLGALGYTWGGIIYDIDDAESDYCYVLIDYSLHMFQDGWKELPYAYEEPPEFDIRWNGVIGDRVHLDVSSMFGADTGSMFIVRLSDKVPSYKQLLDIQILVPAYTSNYMEVEEYALDTETYPGCIAFGYLDYIFLLIIHDVEALNSALGLPSGILTNGMYSAYDNYDFYVAHLVSSAKVEKKIDNKYLDVHDVAISGSYYDLKNRPTIYTDVIRFDTTQSLSSNAKSRARSNIDVYSKSEVDAKISGGVDLSAYAKTTDVESMISTAIGTAIGGSY